MLGHQTRDAEAQCDRGVWVSKLLGAIHLPTDVVLRTTERGRNRADWFRSRPRQSGGQQCPVVSKATPSRPKRVRNQ